MADRFHRGRVTTVGSIVYGLSFVGYVVTPVIEFAFLAAVLGGAGGALFLVALRARVCEGLAADYGAFRRLFSAKGTGTWIAFVAAMMLVSKIGYRGVFRLAAVACAVAAVFLPGFIVYGLLPDHLHAAVRRLGRTRLLILAMLCSALFAAGLSFTPGPRCSRRCGFFPRWRSRRPFRSNRP
jgi:hypothetical protein